MKETLILLYFGDRGYILLTITLPSFFPLLHCLMIIVNLVFDNFESLSDNNKKDVLLYGDSRFDGNKSKFILEATISYVKISEKFSGSLFE